MAAEILVRDPQSGVTTSLIEGERLQVGREEGLGEGTLLCSDPHVSRRHCTLEVQRDGRLLIQDTSTYGTWINEQRVEERGYAQPGDVIVLGHRYKLLVERGVDTDAPTVAAQPREIARARQSTSSSTLSDDQGTAAIPPDQIGERYVVRQVLGEGGMGVVYQAEDRQRERPCAIKVLRATIRGTEQDEALKRFRREAELTHKLGDHPGIVHVFDTGVIKSTGQLYYVMELVEGDSLGSKISRGLELKEGVWLVAQVARSVAHAHDHGVIHRDLKPANVLVARTGLVHLTDFGVARALDEDESRLTVSGTALGTPSFMAPEQIEDSKSAGKPADVYGLGAILYAVLTGRPPFLHKRLGRLIEAVQAGAMTPPRAHNPGVDEELEAICLKAMAVEPEGRHPSAAAFADALESWMSRQAGTESGETIVS